MRRFDAIISDIDGCLSPESSSPMDAAALAQVAEHNRLAQDTGDRPVLTVCSGRPQPFAEAICRLVGNRTLPCIAENGVWLYDPSTNEYDMDPAITPEHLRAVHEATEWVRSDLAPLGVSIQPGKAASISLYHRDTTRLRALEPRVRDEFARRAWPMRVSMTWFYINCDLTHISKATGLDRFSARTGLSRARLAGIGDTPSDSAIADRVAHFCCPANADKSLAARAHYIAPQPETRGVLDILARLSAPA